MKKKRKWVIFQYKNDPTVFKGYICECNSCKPNDFFIKYKHKSDKEDEYSSEAHSIDISYFKLESEQIKRSHLPKWW